MSTSALQTGRIEFTPRPSVPRPQRGGRRPPSDRNNRLRSYPLLRLLTPRGYRRVRNTLQFCTFAGLSCLTTVLFLSSIAAAQPQAATPLPNLAGTYSCEGDETACGWSGWTFTVTQSGADLEIKNEKGEIGSGKVTSRITLSAGPIWNMLGTIVSADNRVIQWSNGTNWRKQ
jgi:hypothetical protein